MAQVTYIQLDSKIVPLRKLADMIFRPEIRTSVAGGTFTIVDWEYKVALARFNFSDSEFKNYENASLDNAGYVVSQLINTAFNLSTHCKWLEVVSKGNRVELLEPDGRVVQAFELRIDRDSMDDDDDVLRFKAVDV